MGIWQNLIIGIVASIIAAIILAIFFKWLLKKIRGNKKLKLQHEQLIEIGKTFFDQGLTKFHFSRDYYGRTLSSFLDDANQSIDIVSISLKISDDEGQLSDLFKRKLSAIPTFTITISLMNPNNQELVKIAADTLDITKEKLTREILEMLKELLTCRESLNFSEKSRFKIFTHDCFPMGSVIMLDATPTGGIIQVETKLYKAARTKSFGFQLTKNSKFYNDNFVAWHRVILDSKPVIEV